LNTQEVYDYDMKTFEDRPSPVCLAEVKCPVGSKQLIKLDDAACPWLKVEFVSERVEVHMTKVGATGTFLLPDQSLNVQFH